MRAKVRELDSDLPIYEVRTTEAQISNSLSTERMIASLSTVFGLLATLLAAIGLYGVMAYSVAQRKREIGIRMALGAEPGTVIWMVMRDVLLLVGIGIAVGVPAALALMQMVATQLYGLSAHDPSTLTLRYGRAGPGSLRGRISAGPSRQPPASHGGLALRIGRRLGHQPYQLSSTGVISATSRV